MGLFGVRIKRWGLMPSACDSGSIFGCAISSFPWIIAVLLGIVVFLVAFRFALQFLERWRRKPAPEPTPAPPPKAVAPGSPLQPTPVPAKKDPKPPQPAKPSPLQLSFADRPDLKAVDFRDDRVQGDFGETLTNIILAQEGWKKLPSKSVGGRGLDGLFVREVRGGGGFEALAVETKTNNAVFDHAAMADDRIGRVIGDLYEAGALTKQATDELMRGLAGGAPFFRKELWRHDLSSGVTAIMQLGPKGEQKTGTSRSYARLMAALHASLKQLDRAAVYVGDKPVDQSDH